MSPIRSILVHMDATPCCAARLELATRLAVEHDAQVIALYAVTSSFAELAPVMLTGGIVVPALVEIDNNRRARARTTFDKAAGAEPGRVAWADLGDESPSRGFSQQALRADLLVLGQRDPHPDIPSGVPNDFVESVLTTSGKPAMVIPYAGRFATVGRTVLVAWKDTRESARALSAALPLLQRAERVHLVSFGPAPARPQSAGPDVEQYLRMHGIDAPMRRYEENPAELGELLLSQAADCSADLLVMGCYGHSRARELVLGGATRTVLTSMTLAVLMAH